MSISFESISKAFGQKQVLDQVSFKVNTGEILFILGKSGMGKSVTLKTIVGLLKPDAGDVSIGEMCVTRLDEEGLSEARKLCGMVFQHPALLDSLTVYENVAFGLRTLSPAQARERVIECLKLVHLDESCLNRKPPEISYGMQKRVSLARTLAPSPRYLLFDEPTTGLDPITTNAINELIFELSRKLKVTSVVVSHDMGCAVRIADRILVLDNARILAMGSVDEIKENKAQLIQDFLKEAI
ncbi:MAG: ATP-binding cassette domain-containing protein [Bdellovibrionota bacterium]